MAGSLHWSTAALTLLLGSSAAMLGVFTAAAAAPAPALLMRVAHASSDATAVDAHLHGQNFVTAAQLAAVTPYTPDPSDPGGPALHATTVDLCQGGAYTITAADPQQNTAPVILDNAILTGDNAASGGVGGVPATGGGITSPPGSLLFTG